MTSLQSSLASLSATIEKLKEVYNGIDAQLTLVAQAAFIDPAEDQGDIMWRGFQRHAQTLSTLADPIDTIDPKKEPLKNSLISHYADFAKACGSGTSISKLGKTQMAPPATSAREQPISFIRPMLEDSMGTLTKASDRLETLGSMDIQKLKPSKLKALLNTDEKLFKDVLTSANSLAFVCHKYAELVNLADSHSKFDLRVWSAAGSSNTRSAQV